MSRFEGHTPGPWTFDGPHHSIIVWGPTPELRICFMTSDGPAEANARLIAAAPALAAENERLREALEAMCALGMSGRQQLEALHKARAALQTTPTNATMMPGDLR